jgi:hypothetical protein
VAALVVAAGGVAGISMQVTGHSAGYSLHCIHANSDMSEAGHSCDLVPVSLGPGSYHVETTFGGCRGFSVSLSSGPTTVDQPVHLMVGTTAGQRPLDTAPLRPFSGTDLTLTRHRDLILEGDSITYENQDGDISLCSIGVTINRTGDWKAPSPAVRTSLRCSTAATPGGGAVAYDPAAHAWKAPQITCPQGVPLGPGDYETEATLTDCGAGVPWLLTGQSTPSGQPVAVMAGQDGATTTAPDGTSPEHSTLFHARFTSLQQIRWTLVRGAQPADARYDNALCAIELTITPTIAAGGAQKSTSAAGGAGGAPAAIRGTPPPDEGPFSWQVPRPGAVEHVSIHAGTYRLDAGDAPSPCGWVVEIPGIGGSRLAHAALPGVLGSDGLSNQVVIPQTRAYDVRVTTGCSLPMQLTWVSRSTGPVHTGAPYPNG